MATMNKRSAYRKVRTALKSGDLVRPATCSKCGANPGFASDGRAMIQAHHHDYNKPLDVEWICPKCHRKETPLPEVVGGCSYGVNNGQAKLTPEIVRTAKMLRATGMIYREIADIFGVHKMTIIRACKGTHWLSAAPEASSHG